VVGAANASGRRKGAEDAETATGAEMAKSHLVTVASAGSARSMFQGIHLYPGTGVVSGNFSNTNTY
jgi:hypothetical protein